MGIPIGNKVGPTEQISLHQILSLVGRNGTQGWGIYDARHGKGRAHSKDKGHDRWSKKADVVGRLGAAFAGERGDPKSDVFPGASRGALPICPQLARRLFLEKLSRDFAWRVKCWTGPPDPCVLQFQVY